jgi:L-threonylcarbamoyladenylate synthase
MTDEVHVTRDVTQALHILQSGGVVAIPTETVYGLAALARDGNAVEKIFAIKGRPRSHPLILAWPTYFIGPTHVTSSRLGHRWSGFCCNTHP